MTITSMLLPDENDDATKHNMMQATLGPDLLLPIVQLPAYAPIAGDLAYNC